MTRPLPNDDSGGDVIQFRGRQTSVVVDGVGVHFGMTDRAGQRAHEAKPVVDDDADPSQTPDGAVARSVAEALTESNPLINWGVACEVCGDVFDSVSGVNSHQSAHSDDGADDGAGDGGDSESA